MNLKESVILVGKSRSLDFQSLPGAAAQRMASAGQFDVISYTGRDRVSAVWRDYVLREAGYTTRVQEYDFAIGKSPREKPRHLPSAVLQLHPYAGPMRPS